MEVQTEEEAAAYFEELVQRNMSVWGHPREEAESIERRNLGYFAGYYGHETRLRVERLFRCSHPVFGKASHGAPTPDEAFEAGKRLATS